MKNQIEVSDIELSRIIHALANTVSDYATRENPRDEERQLLEKYEALLLARLKAQGKVPANQTLEKA